MFDHLNNALTAAEALYPNCAFIVAGDFNQLSIDNLARQFCLKQLVKFPTRLLEHIGPHPD